MSNFSETLKSEPVEILSKEPSQALALVKTYLDEVLASCKKNEVNTKPGLDSIITDGLDANQVWWQVKMVIDNVGADLLDKIHNMKNQTSGDYASDADMSSLDEEHASLESESLESDLNDESDELQNEESEEENDDTEKVKLQEIEGIKNDRDRINESSASDEEEEEEGLETYESNDQEDKTSPGKSQDEVDHSHSPRSSLNDEFFDLDEFNRQTLEADKENQDGVGDDHEEFDYFGDLPSEEEEEALYYNDFFDEPRFGKKITSKNGEKIKKGQEKPELTEEDYEEALDSAKLDLFADDDGLSDVEKEEDHGKKLSTFEKQQLSIEKQIDQLEAEAIAEKKWTLKGEVQSKDRPEDGLLEEDVEFERASKPVPVMTAEETESLEDMIRRRIKERDFDDLPRRVMTNIDLGRHNNEFQLSDQKSSKSLAQLYEDDYKGSSQDADLTEELRKEHDEISDMFDNLVYELDALCSAHFIPKRPKKSLEVRVESPALSMEDAQPLIMSSGQSLAPQEIYKVGEDKGYNELKLRNGMPVTREELTRDDKQRLRRATKRKKAKDPTGGNQKRKKSRRDSTISALSSARNVTVIDKKGEKHDVQGKTRNSRGNEDIDAIKL